MSAPRIATVEALGPGGARARAAGHGVAMAAQLAERLRDMIVTGELAPGARIIERRICEALAVSRTPLREALKLLEIDGLVEIHRHRGARVTPMVPEGARALFEVLAELEGMAARLAAGRIAPVTLDMLERLHAEMVEHFRQNRRDAYFDLNSRIHQGLIAAAENPVLAETHAKLMVHAKRGRYMAILDERRFAEAMGEHDALMAALRVRDGVAAGRIWRRHLLRTGEAVAGVIDRAEDAADGVAIP
ncbi:MAG: GntR family transcriptional regulator [Pseudomonadota bacterium]